MASLIEELITTLEQEHEIYVELIPIAEKKTRIIVNNDLPELQKITAIEQEIVEKINVLEHKRQTVVDDIGTVLNRKSETLNMENIIHILEKEPEEKRKLSEIHDRLKRTIHRLMEINSQNKTLIEQSLEMIEFNMNFVQSTRMLPGNNYTKDASGIGVTAPQTGMFDAKQ